MTAVLLCCLAPSRIYCTDPSFGFSVKYLIYSIYFDYKIGNTNLLTKIVINLALQNRGNPIHTVRKLLVRRGITDAQEKHQQHRR
jgi:hypothetical protein